MKKPKAKTPVEVFSEEEKEPRFLIQKDGKLVEAKTAEEFGTTGVLELPASVDSKN